jgi:hypothetical protein
MNGIFEAAARVTTPIALAAFAVAGIVWILARRKGKVPSAVWAAIIALTLLGLVPIIVQPGSLAMYRVRVNVVGPQGIPIDDARVWSSLGGESKKIAGGWQFDIPAATLPGNKKLTVWASLDAAFLKGSREVQLDGDRNLAATVQLQNEQNAFVRGLVLNRSKQAVAEARVSVAGYDAEAVVTGAGGGFVLAGHAARDQSVLIHVEARGYAGATEWHPAGDLPATIILDRK